MPANLVRLENIEALSPLVTRVLGLNPGAHTLQVSCAHAGSLVGMCPYLINVAPLDVSHSIQLAMVDVSHSIKLRHGGDQHLHSRLWTEAHPH